eukprot:c2745_g1_i1.p1 GENE.c2745_g1_i1~~c2745_g1_i1.p1  ORF type:complete len:433 (+),score=41.79 c2745_g1_i1:1-1299(+)
MGAFLEHRSPPRSMSTPPIMIMYSSPDQPRGSGDQESAAVPVVEEPALSSLMCIMLLGQIGLYVCVFIQMGSTDYVALFWTLLCFGCAAGFIQIVFMFLFHNKATLESIQVNMIAIFISPCTIFVCTWIFTFGILELLLTVLQTTHSAESWSKNDIVLLSVRSFFYLLIVVLCFHLFLSHLESLAQTFGKNLSFYWKLYGILEEEDDPQSMMSIELEPTEATPSTTWYSPIALVLLCQLTLIGLQIPSAWSGYFRGAFLGTFGLSCATLAVLTCYFLFLRSSMNTSLSRAVLSVWAPMPLTIILIDTWCYCTQLLEFFIDAPHTNTHAFFDLVSRFSPYRLLIFILMLVCYFVVLIFGAGTTRIHLKTLAKHKAKRESMRTLSDMAMSTIESPTNNNNSMRTITSHLTMPSEPAAPVDDTPKAKGAEQAASQ